jgi:Protein of unknown function (DUF1579)
MDLPFCSRRDRITFLFAAVALAILSGTCAGDCLAPEHHQFDFWIGDWAIKQKILKADGSWFEADATTKVAPILGGCALVEHWKGDVLFFWEGMEKAEPLQGFSVRAYDPKTKQWVLSWMDSRHPRFGEFVGGFTDGRGEFFRKSPAKDGKQTTTRITFSDITPTSLHWDLAVSSDDGKTWRTLWIMEMTRQKDDRKQ